MVFFAFLIKIETSITKYFIYRITMAAFLSAIESYKACRVLDESDSSGKTGWVQTGAHNWAVAGSTKEEWDSEEVLQKVKTFLFEKDPSFWSAVFSR